MIVRTVHSIFIILFIVSSAFTQSKPKVVASASMIYDITKNIGGDEIDLEMIVPIGGDPHIHEPTPANARLVNKADLIFINGLTFEGWINELIENSGTDGETVTVTDGVDALESQTYDNSTDPHAWMVATNGIIYADNIRKALVNLMPEKETLFNANFESYRAQLNDLHQYIIDEVAKIPNDKRVLITSHDAFQYFGRAYGLRLEAIMGISTDAEAQTSDIMRVNNAIRKYDVPAIFVESTINPKMIKQIAKDNNIVIGGELFADSLGDEESPASTYIDMMKSNTDTIVSALTGQSELTSQEEGSNLPLYLGIAAFLLLATIVGIKIMNK